VVSGFTLRAGRAHVVATPAPTWVASFDARGRLVVRAGGAPFLTLDSPARWRHVEATSEAVSIDGRALRARPGRALTLSISGRGAVRALILSAAGDRGALLLHRVVELHARVPTGQFPVGAGLDDRIHYGDRYWTSGFWPGALWQAAALAPSGGLFASWALAATLAHLGQERHPSHDVGFEYGESSLAGFNAFCAVPAAAGPRFGGSLCDRLRESVVRAADELVALAATNAHAGTIPTTPTSGDTLIDSMMNIAILPFASRVTGDPAYVRLASGHAHRVAALLVRPDGSTIQSVTFDRATGQVLFTSTHQGLSAASTWSRGQAWAVYGFAVAASELHDRALLRVAVRTAGYVARHLPAGGVPRWDYDASPGAPLDVSAGVITAAGLLHLARACHALPGVCVRPQQWVALGRRMLRSALARTAQSPPLGFLGHQVLNQHRPGRWYDGGELIFGLTYALEALKLSAATA
jgi:unsaturated chondroitin disaccharide hydrolase